MNPERIKEWAKKYKKQLIGSAAGVLVAGGVWVMVTVPEQQNPPKAEPLQQEITQTEAVTKAETIPEPELPPRLAEDQIEVLERLSNYLKDKNHQAAADLLFEKEQTLQYLFYHTIEGEEYLYREGALWEDPEGQGLVMKKATEVFYGSFEDGMPEGEGLALQVIELDALRYDYAQGNWEKGKMEGPGLVGYHYYKGIEGEENQTVQKEGAFTGDLLNGEVIYRTTNSEGETTIWKLEAEEGMTKIDDRWAYDEEKQEYRLPSEQTVNHAYVMPQTSVQEVFWRNMLTWEE